MEYSYSSSANQVLAIAKEQAQNFQHRMIGTEHVLLALVIESSGDAGKILRQWNITSGDIRREVERYTGYGSAPKSSYMEMSPRLNMTLNYARRAAQDAGAKEVKTLHILLGLVSTEQVLAAMILKNLNVDLDHLRQDILDDLSEGSGDLSQESNEFFDGLGLNQNKGKGNSKIPTLDSVSINLNKQAREGEIDPVIGRDLETKRVIQILSRRTKNNPVLVGEPGVGKTAVAQAIATCIVKKQVPEDLLDKRVMALDIGSLVAGTKYRGEFEDRMKKILKEIRTDGKVILFVDEMHTLIGAGGAEGAIDASNILKPSLARGDIQMIGATTFDEYQKYIEKDQALARRFQQVRITEPSKEDTLHILEGLKPKYEGFHHVQISEAALKAAVDLSTRYLSNRFLPDKAIDLVDEASATVKINNAVGSNKELQALENELKKVTKQKRIEVEKQNFVQAANLQADEDKLEKQKQALLNKLKVNAYRKAVVNEEDIARVVSEWTGVPATQMKKDDTRKLINLEATLHKRVIGQNKAIQAVAKAIKRSRSGIKDEGRPIGSFLFLGPTGVGKTELAKAVASAVFGSENNLVRIDMSEYMDTIASSKLIGSAPGYVGYEEGGQLSEQVRRHPYSVVLLDEVEKAHPDVFNLLLQVLDDGFLTDSKGRKVDFRNTVIIMTSNLGSRSLVSDKTVGFTTSEVSQEKERISKVQAATKDFFRPEFLNRIDATIVFDQLQKNDLRKIVTLLTQKLVDRLAKKQIVVKFSPAALDVIAKAGFDPENGARPLRRAIQNLVEDKLSDMLISSELVSGQTLKIGAAKGQLKFTVSETKKAALSK